MRELNDEQLVRLTVQSSEAYGELVSRHFCMVYGVAYAHLGEREAAEEAAQEAFLRAYLNINNLRQPDLFGAWVSRIARNVAENWRQRGLTRSRLAAMVPLESVEFEIADARLAGARERLESQQESHALQQALTRLPDAQRQVVLLHFLEGLSKTDIARRFGVNPSSVGRQLDRALRRLRDELGSLVQPAQIQALRPTAQAISRTILVAAGIAAMTQLQRAALQSAVVAASSGSLLTISSSGVVGTDPLLAGSWVSKIASLTTSGGKSMLVTKSLVVAAAVVAGSGVYHYTSSAPGSVRSGKAAQENRSIPGTRLATSNASAGAQAASGTQKITDQTKPAAEGSDSVASSAKQSERLLAQATPPVSVRTPVVSAARPTTPVLPPSVGVRSVTSATPGGVEQVVSSKVSRTKADMRSMATAIESYFVDNNTYPPSDPQKNIRSGASAEAMPCFVRYNLTTPIAYVTSMFSDPFASADVPFAYHAVPKKDNKSQDGWILISPGPDGKFDLDWKLYDPDATQPQPALIPFIYDATNGAVSAGDIWRFKQ